MLLIPRIFPSLLVAIALPSFLVAQSNLTVPASRVRGPINEKAVVTLTGNTHPLARPEADLGSVDGDMRLERLVLVLAPSEQQQRELDALAEAQQDPASASFHQWLTPAEYGARFGVSLKDTQRIATWLASHGFVVEPISASRRSLVFSGTSEQVEETFHLRMRRYVAAGIEHIANADDPQIPEALAPVVAGIVSLHDFRRRSETRQVKKMDATAGSDGDGSRPAPEFTQGTSHYLFPADFAAIYGLNPLYAAGQNGAGVSIAIVGRSNIKLSDVQSFRGYAGLPANQPTVLLDGANPGLTGDQDEATLDVEWAGATAPGASIKFVAAASTATTDGVDLAAQYIVNHALAPVMSTSFGSCEANMGSAEMTFYNGLWQQAATEGISALISSDDSGAAGCTAASASRGTGAGVNGLCSSPYSTCVGGTEFDEGTGKYWNANNGSGNGSAEGYIPERVWNESGANGGSELWASGGGVSGVYVQPSWQKGVSGASSNGMRAVPDIALTAAAHDGYLVWLNGSLYVFAGTSASSPSLAGILALVAQKQSKAGLGNANPALYGMLSASVNPFHATPKGNNSVPGVTGFTASGASYNLATGLGSVNGQLLMQAWPTGTPTAKPGFTLTPSVSSITLQAGKTAKLTVLVSAVGGFSGAVKLTATGPSGVAMVFSPASVTAGQSATVTVTAASGATAGAGKITIAGASGTISGAATVSVTVQAAAVVKAPK
jgi:pseudomonalisin